MCAIAGIVDLKADSATTDKMLASMSRRGPDGKGSHTSFGCTLLHTRLAIVDLSGGQQPMILDWAGERYIITYNGELYNTPELREALTRLGHRFRGHSDTEVVLHAYAQWGSDSLSRLNGIFAFAVWQERSGILFLARDRIGVKPLFYKEHSSGLLFASEIKTLLAYPGVKPVLDIQGAAQITLFGPGRIPGSGVLMGIRELEPGCCGTWEDGKLSIFRYWKLRDGEHGENLQETADHVRYLVSDSIRRQMVADVPVGCFLSGGLDSSIITAVCSQEAKATGTQLNTFSVDYQDNDKYFVPGKFQPGSDKEYIQMMAQTAGTQHHYTVLSSGDLVDALEAATIARDLPGMADVDFSLLAFCGEVRRDVKVALSGECADEIFGGYPWYRDPEIRDAEGFPWAQNSQARCSLMAEGLCKQIQGTEVLSSQYERTLSESDISPDNSPLERRMKEMVNLNFRWFMQTLLDRKDRMSMYQGLEVRVPFCDHRIAEYLYKIPWNYKDLGGREKGLLRKSVTGLLPEAIISRKKSPYPKTYHPVYAAMVQKRLEGLLQDNSAPIFSLFSKAAITAFLDKETPWPWYGQLMTRPQTMAYFLQVDFWLRHYRIDIAL